MSIIIHFSPSHSLQSSTPSSTACSSKVETLLAMGPGLDRNDSNLSIVSPDDSSMVDISTSSVHVYSGKEDMEISVPHQVVGSCFGLPYQDHNYGAPPPPTPPSPSPRMSPVHMCPIVETETVSIVTTTLENDEMHESSITRCVCGYEHDDEYMICCDNCLVWQHVDCMGLDRGNMPETYLCEQCEPRKVDRQKAKLLQAKKKVTLNEKKLIFTETSDESENEGVNRNSEQLTKSRSKSMKRKSVSDKEVKSEQTSPRKGRSHPQAKNVKERMEIKRSKFRRRNKSRSNSTCSTADEEAQDAWKCSSEWPKKKLSFTENVYSDELRLLASSMSSHGEEQKLKKQLQTQWCRTFECENHQRKLVSISDLPSNQLISECKGRFYTTAEFHSTHPLFKQRLFPHILFHKSEHGEFCVDATDYETDAKFVRRSCAPNAEVKHVLLNGDLCLYISSTKSIKKDEEITIPFDVDVKNSSHDIVCACNTNTCLLLTHRKNGSIDTGEKRRRSRRHTHSTDDDSNHSLSSAIMSPVKSIKGSPLRTSPLSQKVTVTQPDVGESEHSDSKNTTQEQESEERREQKRKMTREERKLDAIMRAFDQMERAAKRRQQALDRLAQSKSQTQKSEDSYEKQEGNAAVNKDDEKRANSLSGDASTFVDEEKPVVSTVHSTPHSTKSKKGKRRRGSGTPSRRRTRSNSGGSEVFNNEDASACDSSLQCLSSSSSVETCDAIPLEPSISSPVTVHTSPVLPKTKRFLHHEWLQEKVETAVPVSCPLSIHTEVSWGVMASTPTCYVRCTKDSPSTGGISAAHLRRSSIAGNQSKQISGQGSAKKRWLRQAMNDSEPCEVESTAAVDMTLNGDIPSPVNNTCFSPPRQGDVGSPCVSPQEDVVTPLKKRRIMRNSLESSSSSTEWTTGSLGLSPDHSSSEPASDSFADATPVVEDLKVELSNEESSVDKCIFAGNGLSKHLLKSLRENWIKNESKERENSPRKGVSNFSDKPMKVEVSQPSETIKVEMSDPASAAAPNDPMKIEESNVTSEAPSNEPLKNEESNSTSEAPPSEPMKNEVRNPTSEAPPNEPMKNEVSNPTSEVPPLDEPVKIEISDPGSKAPLDEPMRIKVSDPCPKALSDESMKIETSGPTSEAPSGKPMKIEVNDASSEAPADIPIKSKMGNPSTEAPYDEPMEIEASDPSSEAPCDEHMKIRVSDPGSETPSDEPTKIEVSEPGFEVSSDELIKIEVSDPGSEAPSDKPMKIEVSDPVSEVSSDERMKIEVSDPVSEVPSDEPMKIEMSDPGCEAPSDEPMKIEMSDPGYEAPSDEPTKIEVSDSGSEEPSDEPVKIETSDPDSEAPPVTIEIEKVMQSVVKTEELGKSDEDVQLSCEETPVKKEENSNSSLSETPGVMLNTVSSVLGEHSSCSTENAATDDLCKHSNEATKAEEIVFSQTHDKLCTSVNKTESENHSEIISDVEVKNRESSISGSDELSDTSNVKEDKKEDEFVETTTDPSASDKSTDELVSSPSGSSSGTSLESCSNKILNVKSIPAKLSEGSVNTVTHCNIASSDISYAQVMDVAENCTPNNDTMPVNNSTAIDDPCTSSCLVLKNTSLPTPPPPLDIISENNSTVPAASSDHKKSAEQSMTPTTTAASETINDKGSSVACKRKVSLSEYRQRKRDNHGTVPLKNEKKKNNNNNILKTIEPADTFLEEQIKLAALPLFQKKMTKKLPPITLPGGKVFKATDKPPVRETKKDPVTQPRENLTERLKREFGFDDISDSKVKKKDNSENAKANSVSSLKAPPAVNPILSLCSHLPPPPPPPVHPAGKNSTPQFIFAPQPYAQQSSFLISPQISPNQYVPGQKPLNPPPMIPIHPMSSLAITAQPSCTYAAAMHTSVGRPAQLPHTPTSNQRFQQPGAHPMYHSPFTSRAYK